MQEFNSGGKWYPSVILTILRAILKKKSYNDPLGDLLANKETFYKKSLLQHSAFQSKSCLDSKTILKINLFWTLAFMPHNKAKKIWQGVERQCDHKVEVANNFNYGKRC